MLVCYCDGGCNNKTKDHAYGSFVVWNESSTELSRQRLEFPNCTTSNEAEYEIYICLLEYLLEKGYTKDSIEHIEIHSDSKLMVNQVNGGWRLEAENLKERRLMAVDLMKILGNVKLTWVSRKVIVPILGH